MSQQPSHPSWVGHTISGRYKIEAVLGQGGMSSVYKAIDPNLRRPVAIKLIHPHLSSDPEFVRRFEQEAAAVAQLRHQHIIQVFDFNHDNNVYYMVLEFLPGQTLQERLSALNKANQRLPLQDSVDIMAKICNAVAYAHTQNMIHRDLKPANVMLDPNGQPVLMDFGVAKMLGASQHTATGAIIGTAKYMSPEQARGDRPDERTDIYSLGIMLYEMVTGATPFEGESTVAILMKHVTEEPPNIRQIDANIPEGLIQVIEKALAKDRNARFQTASDMADALRHPQLLSAVPVGPDQTALADNDATMMQAPSPVRPAQPAQPAQSAPAAPPPPPAATPKSGLPMWLIGAGALVLLLIIGGGIGLFAMSGSGGDTPTATPSAKEAAGQTENNAAAPTQESVLVAEQPTATDVPPSPTTAPTDTPPPPTATPTDAPASGASASDALPAATAPASPESDGDEEAAPTPEPPPPTDAPLPVPPAGMVLAPAGFFQMGSTTGPANEQPRHPVLLDGFFIDRTEVTNAQYRACVTAGDCTPGGTIDSFTRPGYRDDPAFDDYPVVGVTWDQAVAYCSSVGKRLPTEAEWEYAAAGPNSLTYPWGNSFNLSLTAAGSPDTEPVDSFPGGASPVGALNMAGNVAEWVADSPGNYADSQASNPQNSGGNERIFRGGSFANADGDYYRTSKRYSNNRDFIEVDMGIRCAQTVPAPGAAPSAEQTAAFCAIYAKFNPDGACP